LKQTQEPSIMIVQIET